MKSNKKLILLIIIGVLFTLNQYRNFFYGTVFSQVFSYCLLGIPWLFIFIDSIYDETVEYINSKKINSFILTFIGLFIVLLNLSIYIYFERKFNQPSLIKAKNYGVFADFKKNGTYVINSGEWPDRYHHYGNYTLNDSVLKIDNKKLSYILTTNTFVIRKKNDSLSRKKEFLVLLDKDGNEVMNLLHWTKDMKKKYTYYRFEIDIDNRKKTTANNVYNE